MGAPKSAPRPFISARLRMARELAGRSQSELAVVAGVTSAAISQYERGPVVPSTRVIRALADYLEVRPEFFAVDDGGTDVPAFFRSLRSVPAKDRKRARHFVQLVHQVARELERDVRLPALDVPRIPVREDADVAAPERAAAEVRRLWQLPPGPLENIVRLVERHGVLVARLRGGHSNIDAFSVPFADRPIIVMSAMKGKRDRSRFDVAHELGHLVMHSSGQVATRAAEAQAHRFAAGLLMPADDVWAELPASPDWARLQELKRRWQCSIGSLLLRSRTLGVMSDETYVAAMKIMSARGWRRDEPVDLGPAESPLLLSLAVETAGLDAADLSERTAISLPRLREVLDLAADQRPSVVI